MSEINEFVVSLGLLCIVSHLTQILLNQSLSLKRSGNRRKGIRDAITYGVSIVVIHPERVAGEGQQLRVVAHKNAGHLGDDDNIVRQK